MSAKGGGFERLAVWLAHGKKCAYCGELIQLRDLEIDHILPSHLENDPARLRHLITELGLPPSFEIDTACNFLPAHSWCNSRKSAHIFNESSARYFLGIADSKLKSLQRHRSELELQAAKESLLGMVRAALERGSLGLDDLIDHGAEVSGIPLATKIEFLDGEWDGHDRSGEIEALLDRPILFGRSPSIDGIEFVNGSGGSRTIRTCREYRAAKADGFYAGTNFALKMEAYVGAAEAILSAVAGARPPVTNYLRQYFVGVADLNLLPPSLLPAVCLEHIEEIKGLRDRSLQELALSGKINILDVTSTRLNFVYKHLGMVLKELLRADLDGDGDEEILVQTYMYAIGGTLGVSSIGLLRRPSLNVPFEYASWPPKSRILLSITEGPDGQPESESNSHAI